jgi:hypothetical protein
MNTFKGSVGVPAAGFDRSTGQWALAKDAWYDTVKVSGSTNGHSSVKNVPIMSRTFFLVGTLSSESVTGTEVNVAILLEFVM